MIGGVRGSHIVLPRFPHAPESALYLEAVDGRPIFVVPWNGQILVGTTEIRDDGDPAEVQPDTEEIDYLVKSLAKQLPGAAISADQIKFAYAGVRPLPRVTEENPAAITRRHFLHDHADDGAAGMISVVGGKLTTAASLARECAARIGCAMAQESAVHVLPPRGGAEFRLEDWARGAAESSGLAPQCARAIAEWFGRSAASVLDLARRDPNMRQRLCPHSAHVVAEAVHAMFCEQALTLGDVLLRRVPLALGSCWSPECARFAAQHIGHALGWNDRQVAAELDLLIAEQETFLKKPVSAALPS
jgi:glycerol-3-phosphate dehydrogenase